MCARLSRLLALPRGVLVAASVTLSLVVSDVFPWPSALFLGVVVGSLSGALQYFNEEYLAWLSSGSWFSVSRERSSLLGFYVKDASILLAYLAVFQVSLSLVAPQPSGVTVDEFVALALTFAVALYSETIWYFANSEWTRIRIEREPGRERFYRSASDGISMIHSIVVTGIEAVSLRGGAWGTALLALLGTGGIVAAVTLRRGRVGSPIHAVAHVPAVAAALRSTSA